MSTYSDEYLLSVEAVCIHQNIALDKALFSPKNICIFLIS